MQVERRCLVRPLARAGALALVAALAIAPEARARTTRPGASAAPSTAKPTAAPATAKPGTAAAKAGAAAAKPKTAAAKPKTAAAKPATAAAKPATAAAKPKAPKSGKPGTAAAGSAKVASAKPAPKKPSSPGSACARYAACLRAMADAYGASTHAGTAEAVAAVREAAATVEAMSAGSAAEESCALGLDAMAKTADVYAAWPDFVFPLACAAAAPAPPAPALLVRVRRARILPAAADGRAWDGRTPLAPEPLRAAARDVLAGRVTYDDAFSDLSLSGELARADRPDASAVVSLNGAHAGRTSIVRDAFDPAWRDGPDLRVTAPEADTIEVVVWDDDGGSSLGERLGTCRGRVPPDAVTSGRWTLRCEEGVYEIDLIVRTVTLPPED